METIADYPIYVKGSLDGHRRYVFSREKNRLYVRCPQCLKIMEVKDPFDQRLIFDRKKSYRQNRTCSVCWNCKDHFYFVTPTSRSKYKRIMNLIRKKFGHNLKFAILSDPKEYFQLYLYLENRRAHIYRNKRSSETYVEVTRYSPAHHQVLINRSPIIVEEAIQRVAEHVKTRSKT